MDRVLLQRLRRQLEAVEGIVRDLNIVRHTAQVQYEEATQLRDQYVDLIRAMLTEDAEAQP